MESSFTLPEVGPSVTKNYKKVLLNINGVTQEVMVPVDSISNVSSSGVDTVSSAQQQQTPSLTEPVQSTDVVPVPGLGSAHAMEQEPIVIVPDDTPNEPDPPPATVPTATDSTVGITAKNPLPPGTITVMGNDAITQVTSPVTSNSANVQFELTAVPTSPGISLIKTPVQSAPISESNTSTCTFAVPYNTNIGKGSYVVITPEQVRRSSSIPAQKLVPGVGPRMMSILPSAQGGKTSSLPASSAFTGGVKPTTASVGRMPPSVIRVPQTKSATMSPVTTQSGSNSQPANIFMGSDGKMYMQMDPSLMSVLQGAQAQPRPPTSATGSPTIQRVTQSVVSAAGLKNVPVRSLLPTMLKRQPIDIGQIKSLAESKIKPHQSNIIKRFVDNKYVVTMSPEETFKKKEALAHKVLVVNPVSTRSTVAPVGPTLPQISSVVSLSCQKTPVCLTTSSAPAPVPKRANRPQKLAGSPVIIDLDDDNDDDGCATGKIVFDAEEEERSREIEENASKEEDFSVLAEWAVDNPDDDTDTATSEVSGDACAETGLLSTIRKQIENAEETAQQPKRIAKWKSAKRREKIDVKKYSTKRPQPRSSWKRQPPGEPMYADLWALYNIKHCRVLTKNLRLRKDSVKYRSFAIEQTRKKKPRKSKLGQKPKSKGDVSRKTKRRFSKRRKEKTPAPAENKSKSNANSTSRKSPRPLAAKTTQPIDTKFLLVKTTSGSFLLPVQAKDTSRFKDVSPDKLMKDPLISGLINQLSKEPRSDRLRYVIPEKKTQSQSVAAPVKQEPVTAGYGDEKHNSESIAKVTTTTETDDTRITRKRAREEDSNTDEDKFPDKVRRTSEDRHEGAGDGHPKNLSASERVSRLREMLRKQQTDLDKARMQREETKKVLESLDDV